MADGSKTVVVGPNATQTMVVAVSSLYDMTANAMEYAGNRPLHAGDDYNHDFIVQGIAGVALPITKAWFTIKFRTKDADTDAVLQYVSTDAAKLEITDGPNGLLTVKFNAADTEDLEGPWFYDLQVLSGGKVETVARGNIEFLPNITRALL